MFASVYPLFTIQFSLRLLQVNSIELCRNSFIASVFLLQCLTASSSSSARLSHPKNRSKQHNFLYNAWTHYSSTTSVSRSCETQLDVNCALCAFVNWFGCEKMVFTNLRFNGIFCKMLFRVCSTEN